MKNNIFLLIAASIFILSFSSCDDLLDVTPKDKITPETFFSTEADLQAFSTNFYNSLPKDRDLYKDDADNITHSTPNSAATDSRTVPAPRRHGLLGVLLRRDDGGSGSRDDHED